AVFYQRRHFLDDGKLHDEENDRVSEPGKEYPPKINVAATERICVCNVGFKDVHRKIGEARQHRDDRAPTEIPQRATQQIRIYFFLRVRIKRLLERNIYQIEKVEQTDPGDTSHEVGP